MIHRAIDAIDSDASAIVVLLNYFKKGLFPPPYLSFSILIFSSLLRPSKIREFRNRIGELADNSTEDDGF